MSKFRSTATPSSQPRSLRTQAETNSGPFPDAVAVDTAPGGTYEDAANAARPASGNNGQNVADKNAFRNLKRG